MMKRTIFLTCCIILSMLFMPGMAFAAGNGFEELEYGDGQKLYVLLPSDFDPGQEYPSVWFMPPDGAEPQQNHDMYGFDIDHIMMGIYLRELGIPHVFEIDDGGHDSAFYLPRLKDGFAYLLQDV